MNDITKKIDQMMDEVKKSGDKVNKFTELLDSLDSTDEKRRLLWQEIYENAVSDRERASILFTEAFKAMGGGTADHMSIGPTLVKYLERMCKSNGQLITLSEMIEKAEAADSRIDPDDIFSKISDKE